MSAIDKIITLYHTGKGASALDGDDMQLIIDARIEANKYAHQLDVLNAWNMLWIHICKRMGGDADLPPSELNFDYLIESGRLMTDPKTLAQLRAELAQAQQRIAELTAERDAAQETCERMNEIIKNIAKERGDARAELDALRTQLATYQRREALRQ